MSPLCCQQNRSSVDLDLALCLVVRLSALCIYSFNVWGSQLLKLKS